LHESTPFSTLAQSILAHMKKKRYDEQQQQTWSGERKSRRLENVHKEIKDGICMKMDGERLKVM
jgi:hypothetical protein